MACRAAGVERRTEDEVVDLRQLVVNALDKIVLDGSHGERSRTGVRSRNQVFIALCFTVE